MKRFLLAVVLLSVYSLNFAKENTENIQAGKTQISGQISTEHYGVLNEPQEDDSRSENDKEKTSRTLFHLIALKKLKLLLELLFWKNYMQPTTTAQPISTTTQIPNTTPTADEDCGDLIIALDSSGSVRPHNYQTSLHFAASLAEIWISHATSSRLEVMVFSDGVDVLFNLEESALMSLEDIQKAILNAPYHSGSLDNLHLPVEQAAIDFLRFNRSSSIRFSSRVPKNLLLLSDGYSNLIQTQHAADKFYMIPGARGFAVGIGNSVIDEELLAIVNNIAENVFKIRNFDELDAIFVENVNNALCNTK